VKWLATDHQWNQICHRREPLPPYTMRKPRKSGWVMASPIVGIFKAKEAAIGQSNLVLLVKTMNAIKPASRDRLMAPLATIPASQVSDGDIDWFPPVDILENAEEYLFRIDLPGTKPENVRVVVEGDGLFISGDRPEAEWENMRCLRVERPRGHFERRFALPDDASREEIDSKSNESVLEVHVRKVRSLAQNSATGNEPPGQKIAFAS
jgi:HSP20 family protein